MNSRATLAIASIAVLLWGPSTPVEAKPDKDKPHKTTTTTTTRPDNLQAPSLPSCTPPGSSVSCTIPAVVTPDVPSRTVVVRLFGQELTSVTTPAIHIPNTTTQTITVAVSQSLGTVLGYMVSDCRAEIRVNPGSASLMIAVNGTPVFTAAVNVPGIGEVVAFDACQR